MKEAVRQGTGFHQHRKIEVVEKQTGGHAFATQLRMNVAIHRAMHACSGPFKVLDCSMALWVLPDAKGTPAILLYVSIS
jgi:hypothetical protein